VPTLPIRKTKTARPKVFLAREISIGSEGVFKKPEQRSGALGEGQPTRHALVTISPGDSGDVNPRYSLSVFLAKLL
jgi:hypothetical protein